MRKWVLAVGAFLGCLAADPSTADAQGIAWHIGPAVVVDTDFPGRTPVGPGLTAELELAPDRSLSYSAMIFLGRTDFPVGMDELHRNWGAVALSARFMRETDRPSVGFVLGLGALFEDDVSETDPGFRSGARGAELLLPGLELRWPLRDGLALSFSVRDQVTGWWWSIFDPSEGDLSHRLLLGAGVVFR